MYTLSRDKRAACLQHIVFLFVFDLKQIMGYPSHWCNVLWNIINIDIHLKLNFMGFVCKFIDSLARHNIFLDQVEEPEECTTCGGW